MIQKNEYRQKQGWTPGKGAVRETQVPHHGKDRRTGEYYALKSKAGKASLGKRDGEAGGGRVGGNGRLTTEQADFIRKLCGMANNLNQLTRRAHREGVRLHSGQCRHLLLSLETLIDRISL